MRNQKSPPFAREDFWQTELPFLQLILQAVKTLSHLIPVPLVILVNNFSKIQLVRFLQITVILSLMILFCFFFPSSRQSGKLMLGLITSSTCIYSEYHLLTIKQARGIKAPRIWHARKIVAAEWQARHLIACAIDIYKTANILRTQSRASGYRIYKSNSAFSRAEE